MVVRLLVDVQLVDYGVYVVHDLLHVANSSLRGYAEGLYSSAALISGQRQAL